MSSSTLPPNFHSVTPLIVVRNADEAIRWYQKVFHAEEIARLTDPGGTIAHAEIKIGDSVVMMAEEQTEFNKSPQLLNGTSVIIHLYVDNVDEVVVRAVKAGARLIFEVKDQFYGDRSGRFEDPFGHMWIVATSIRKISPEDMQRIFDEMMGKKPG